MKPYNIDTSSFEWCKKSKQYKQKEKELNDREENIIKKEKYTNILLVLSIVCALFNIGCSIYLRGMIW